MLKVPMSESFIVPSDSSRTYSSARHWFSVSLERMRHDPRRMNALIVPLMVALFILLGAKIGIATPSTTYWTPATTDIQPYGVLHLGVDNYFTIFKEAEDGGSALPTDAGLTIGILPFESLQMEVGVDLIEPTDDPISFNAKLGTPEGSLFNGSPALNIGIFNAGTEDGVTDQDIVYGLVGKTIPYLGRLHFGPYIGNGDSLIDADGDAANKGVMIGYDRGFLPFTDREGNEFNRLIFAADYASGNNSIGGGGFGLYYFFTKDISLLTGPVWFNESEINGEWKWTIQLDINMDLLDTLKKLF